MQQQRVMSKRLKKRMSHYYLKPSFRHLHRWIKMFSSLPKRNQNSNVEPETTENTACPFLILLGRSFPEHFLERSLAEFTEFIF